MNLAILQKQPWLIAPEAFGAMLTATRSFFSDPPTSPPAPEPESACLSIDAGIGIISLRGPMMRNPDIIDRVVLGACDTDEIRSALAEAGQRADVEAVLLDIDSPGGTVNGTPELAQAVAALSKAKAVYAFSSGEMCSAAYWVASQADAIYASPSARIGSIGVILPVLDSSAAFEQAGLKMEVFAAGRFKSTGIPGTSLTQDQRDWLQAEVEEIAMDFRSAVLARGRKIPDEAMEGQTFSSRRAMRFNLAGMAASLDEVLARLRQQHVRQIDTASSSVNINNPSAQEKTLIDAQARIAKLEQDAQAHDHLLEEANRQINSATAQCQQLQSERTIDATTLAQLTNDLTASRKQVDDLLRRNAELEGRETDVERRAAARAAEIIAETGVTTPAKITPKGDDSANGTDALIQRFRSITDPTAQTAFWRSLTTEQRALILRAA